MSNKKKYRVYFSHQFYSKTTPLILDVPNETAANIVSESLLVYFGHLKKEGYFTYPDRPSCEVQVFEGEEWVNTGLHNKDIIDSPF